MSKRMPLVNQHLENISREALEKFQDIVRRYVRRRQGVYVRLWGQACNFAIRIDLWGQVLQSYIS